MILNGSFLLLLLLLLLRSIHTKDFYFYADVRWDNVDHFKSHPETIPYNHGLRIIPALHVALEKLKVLHIWSASPKVNGYVTDNFFYRSNSEFLASCRTVNNSDGNWDSPCFLHANYDVGFCSPEELTPADASVATLHCKNNPPDDHVFSFLSNQTNTSSVSLPMLPKGSKINLVLPDGTGLSQSHQEDFNNKFSEEELSDSISLKEMNVRIKFIAWLLGDEFAGIVGSTDNAYNSALISRQLGVPNIVPSVTDSKGMWPIRSDTNFESGILDNSLVLGYEDWMILDMLTYIINEAGWAGGSMQILHESGYSERLALSIRSNLQEELEKRVGVGDNIRITKDMYLDRISTWDYYVPASERGSVEDVHLLLDIIPSRTRIILLLGKEDFIRNTLQELHLRNMYKINITHSRNDVDDIGGYDQFGIVIIPDNGAPCGDMIRPYSGGASNSEDIITQVLDGAFLLCHNAHNRNIWRYKNPTLMSNDGSNTPGKFRWKLDPPSMNTLTDYEESIGEESYKLNRRYLGREDELDLKNWNIFEEEFREEASSALGFSYPPDQSVSGLAGFAHDSLIWGMFTALLNRTHPNLFVSRSGEFTLVNLYSDGTTHPNTRSYPTADMKRIGWPGMFGVDSPPISVYNTTHVMKNSSFLINDGPWHDIVNRYTFKDNRPFGSVPHRIKIFQDGKWKALAGLLPHRRKKERDSGKYEQEAAKLSSELHFDSFGNSLETGVPFYDKYKFIRYSRAEQGHITADESSCGYDYLICHWRRRVKWIITIASAGCVGAILVFGPLIYLFLRWRKFNTELNAMRWRLKDSEVTFRYQYTDKQSGTDSESSSSSSESSDESITNIEAINGFIMPTLTIKKGSDHAPNRLGIDYNRRKSNFSGVRDRRRMPSAAGNCRRKSYFVKNDPSGSFLKLSKINEGSALSVESEEDTRDYIYTDIAIYNDHEWAAKELSRAATYIIKGSGRNFRIEMKELLEIKHKNVAKLCGVVYNNNLAGYTFLSQYCKRGSLKNVLEDKDFIFDMEIKLSFICDMIHGMEYLHHHTSIGSHGYLKSSNVLVTGCLTAKIADFGTLCRVSDTEKLEELGESSANIHSMWSAPEILREQIQLSVFGTKEGDVYSFGIICHEILEHSGPFNTQDHHGLDAQEIVTLVRKCHPKTPYRPAYSVNPNMDTKERAAVNMSLQCWSEEPAERPSFRGLLRDRVPAITSIRKSVVEHALETVKQYSKKKEKQIAQLDSELRSIRGEIERVRLQILPWEVAENIEEGIYPGIESLPSTSIMCIEITGGLNLLESGVSSRDVWAGLQAIRDEIFSFINYYPGLFCTLATESMYVIIANGFNQHRDNVTVTLRQLYKELVIFVKKLELPRGRLRVRAGMDSGTVETGVVGDQVLSYQIFGPVYTIADMMRSNAGPGKLLVSENSKKLLKSDNFKETGAYKYKHSVYYQPGQNLLAS